jgi:amino acid transporter
MRQNWRPFRARRIAGFIVLAAVGIIAFGMIVMLLWNALMPEIFHLPTITYWQALGLLVLTKIFFANFRGGGPKSRMKDRLREKWMTMTPEEREKFRQDWGSRCGGGGR